MSFRVTVSDVEGYGRLVGRAAEDANAVSEHVRSNATVDGGLASELWEMCATNHEEYVQITTQVLGKIRSVLQAASEELGNVAKEYSGTDAQVSKRLDGTYGNGGAGTPGGTSGTNSAFTDATDAKSALSFDEGGTGWKYLDNHVGEFQFAAPAKILGTIADLGSPSALLNEAFKLLGFDPYETLLKAVMGDWESYDKCGQTWGRIAKACAAIADNVKSGNDTLATSWDGNAADAAWGYFNRFQDTMREVEKGFGQLNNEYYAVARFVFGLAELLKAGLAFIIDRALVALAFYLAGVAASATVVGAPGAAVSFLAATSQVIIAIDKFGDLLKAVEQISLAVSATLVVAGAGAAGIHAMMQSFPEVGGSYDHPSARV